MDKRQIAEIIAFFWVLGIVGYIIKIILVVVKKLLDE